MKIIELVKVNICVVTAEIELRIIFSINSSLSVRNNKLLMHVFLKAITKLKNRYSRCYKTNVMVWNKGDVVCIRLK